MTAQDSTRGGSRRLRLLAVCAFAALCGVALAVLLLSALARPGLRARLDLTQGGRAGLSARTVAALQALPEDAELTLFLLPEEEALLWNGSSVYPRAFDRLRALTEDARVRAGGGLRSEILDAGSALVAISDAERRLERQPGETLVLSAGGLRKALRFEELFQVVQPRPDGTPARILGERIDEALGDAALGLGAGQRPRLAFVTGSGQGALDDPEGLATLRALLERQSWEPVAVAGPADAVDADLLLVAGQQLPFGDADLDALGAWLDAGRPLLVALGPFAPATVIAQWNELLAARGSGFGDGLVCQPVRANTLVPAEGTEYSAQLQILPVQLAPMHGATTALAASSRATLLGGCRPVVHASGTNDWSQERLVRSDERAWIDDPRGVPFSWDADEPRGIVPLAVACERWTPTAAGNSGRTAVFGTAQALRGRELALAQDLVLGTLRWLLDEDEAGGLVGVQELPFRPTAAQLGRIQGLALWGLPGLTLLIGLAVYWRRRR